MDVSSNVSRDGSTRVSDSVSDRKSLPNAGLSLLGDWRSVLLAIVPLAMQVTSMLCMLASFMIFPNK